MLTTLRFIRNPAIAAAVFFLSAFISAAQTNNRSLIPEKFDQNQLVTLTGNTRPEATAETDRGVVAGDMPLHHLMLVLRRSPEQEEAMKALVDEQHDPASPNFHKWLTPVQLGERFGVSQPDIAKISAWLRANGFSVNTVYANRMLIDFSGSAAAVKSAFHTEIHNLSVNGRQHIANMSDPQIPAALAPAVAGVSSLNNFMPHPALTRKATSPLQGYNTGSSGYNLVAPADLYKIYDVNPLLNAGITGKGQTIVVAERTDVYSVGDVSTFRKAFGLARAYPFGTYSQIHPGPGPGGPCADPGVNGDDGEATLDAEWASAAAPNAHIVAAVCADSNFNFGPFTAIQNVLNSTPVPQIISLSYIASESSSGESSNLYVYLLYQQAAAEGVSVFVSSGDWGADVSEFSGVATLGINANGLGATPYNVSVGGTDFSDFFFGTTKTYWDSTNGANYVSAKSYVPEVPWNDTCASKLLANYVGYPTTYAYCNSTAGAPYLGDTAGSGGPSGCATGSPNVPGVVGGSCAGLPKPSWQQVFGNPHDNVRDTPDVSLFASNGFLLHYYPFCYSDPAPGRFGVPCQSPPSSWSGGGGTSFAAPIWAGFQALFNERAHAVSGSGNPLPVYYELARKQYGSSGNHACDSSLGNAASSQCVFYDVTQGDIDIPCKVDSNGDLNDCYRPAGTYGVLSTSNSSYQPAYGTNAGWDFATGLGTVNVLNLANGYAIYLESAYKP